MKKDKKDKKIKKGKKPVQPAEAVPLTELPAPQEPLAYLADVIGGKWKLRILWAMAAKENLRYGDIKRAVDGITDMMLSQSLKDMVNDHLVERVQYQEIPPRVEYSLTPKGSSLLPILSQLRKWAVSTMNSQR